MAEQALIEEIRRRAELDIEAAWRQARADAEAYQRESDRAIAAARVRASEQLAAKTLALTAAAKARADASTREIRAAANRSLATRLHALAIDQLPRFRTVDYPRLLDALVGELPERRWQRVTVHPDDRDLAKSRFPDAEIVPDRAVEAGLVVECEDGRVRVANTLRTRLEIAWPDLLPVLMREAREAMPPL